MEHSVLPSPTDMEPTRGSENYLPGSFQGSMLVSARAQVGFKGKRQDRLTHVAEPHPSPGCSQKTSSHVERAMGRVEPYLGTGVTSCPRASCRAAC